MDKVETKNSKKTALVRMPFRILLLVGFLFVFYVLIKDIVYATHNKNIFFLALALLYFFVLFGFVFQIIFKKDGHGHYFFNYNYENNKIFKHFSKKSKKPKKQRKVYFKEIRLKFDKFLVSKTMVQIWGLLDLLTLVIFWQYFYDNFILVYEVLYKEVSVKFSMIPHYITALTSISLLFSGILLIATKKLGGRLIGFQMLLKMFAYLPSIFPILWLLGFSIEHRYLKALVITTFCVEFVRVETIHHFFKFNKNRYYTGFDENN